MALRVRMTGRAYSFDCIQPIGQFVQLLYALAAVAGGAPSVGIKAASRVVLASKKEQKSVPYDE